MTGWTWEYIDDCMDIPRLDALNSAWSQYPPVHVSVAAYLGIGKQKNTAASDAEFDAMMASLPAMSPPPQPAPEGTP